MLILLYIFCCTWNSKVYSNLFEMWGARCFNFSEVCPDNTKHTVAGFWYCWGSENSITKWRPQQQPQELKFFSDLLLASFLSVPFSLRLAIETIIPLPQSRSQKPESFFSKASHKNLQILLFLSTFLYKNWPINKLLDTYCLTISTKTLILEGVMSYTQKEGMQA